MEKDLKDILNCIIRYDANDKLEDKSTAEYFRIIQKDLKQLLQQSDVKKSDCEHNKVDLVRYAYKCEKCGTVMEGKY